MYVHLLPLLAMHAVFVHAILVGYPMVIVLGCMFPWPNNNINNYSSQY